MDRMSEAVEDAIVILYGVSRAYKESANCRLEAQYAVQQQKDLVPLMMEDGYQAKGWLGLILGTRMYYRFSPAAVATEEAFTESLNSLTREIDLRGKKPQSANRATAATSAVIPEAVPPNPESRPTARPTPVPVLVSTPEPAPVSALPEPVAAVTPQQQAAADNSWFSPSLHQPGADALAGQPATGTAGAVALLDMPTLVELVDRMQSRADADRRAMASTAEQQQTLLLEARVQAAVEQERLRVAEANLRQQQLASLHSRLEAVHSAGLLESHELHALEDALEDSLDAAATAGGDESHRTAAQMMALAGRTASDTAFARQLRRKFLR